MNEVRAYGTPNEKSVIGPMTIQRRDPGPNDLVIEIQYCGICHSDIHQARNEWGGSVFPMVPGHEIVGKVIQTGTKVSRFKVGDQVGVGCFVDSCRICSNCKHGLEQYCDGHLAVTYNGYESDKKTPTFGGYSSRIVVDESYTLNIPAHLPLPNVAPLLCAGITTYSPLKHVGAEKGKKVAILGLGGLGHMGVKFAAAFGCEVTVLSTSPSKEADAKRLGAHAFISSKNEAAMKAASKSFDIILDTVSAQHSLATYLDLLKLDGTMIMVGVPEKPLDLHTFSIIGRRRKLMGSLIGGIKETQEMLNFCGDKNITSDIELIPASKINEAYERTLKADVRYRFVIDNKTI